jgi:hypothetical protein
MHIFLDLTGDVRGTFAQSHRRASMLLGAIRARFTCRRAAGERPLDVPNRRNESLTWSCSHGLHLLRWLSRTLVSSTTDQWVMRPAAARAAALTVTVWLRRAPGPLRSQRETSTARGVAARSSMQRGDIDAGAPSPLAAAEPAQ